MANEPGLHQQSVPTTDPSTSAGAMPETNGGLSQLQNECAQLRQVVRRLEDERQRDRETLATMQKERDEYHHMLLALARERFTDEQLLTIPEEKDCVTLEQFLPELEQIVRGS